MSYTSRHFCFNEAAGFTQRETSDYEVAERLGRSRFNEAAGFTQRKHQGGSGMRLHEAIRFNEAAGFTQRKRRRALYRDLIPRALQ